MSSDGTATGRDGVFAFNGDRVARTTQWNNTHNLTTKTEWGDSDSAGYTNRAAGRVDSTFTAEGKFDFDHSQLAIFVPGDIAEATLFLLNGPWYYHYPRALCDSFNLVVNMDTQEVIGWTGNWGSDGIFYYPGQSGAPSKSIPSL